MAKNPEKVEKEQKPESPKIKSKTPDAPEHMRLDEPPLVWQIESEQAKIYYDAEKRAYRIKATDKRAIALLGYIGLTQKGFVGFADEEAILALLRRIREKAVIQAKLFE